VRNIILGLVVLIGLSGAACNDKGKQFAATTDRVAGYVGTGLILVDQYTSTGQMSNETGVAIVTVLRQVNTLNGQLVTEAKTYVQPDGTLALTGDGQQKLLNILASSTSIINTLTNDPRVLALPDTQKTQINALVGNLGATIATLGELVKTVKLVKEGK
jgi:hypothetical protein